MTMSAFTPVVTMLVFFDNYDVENVNNYDDASIVDVIGPDEVLSLNVNNPGRPGSPISINSRIDQINLLSFNDDLDDNDDTFNHFDRHLERHPYPPPRRFAAFQTEPGTGENLYLDLEDPGDYDYEGYEGSSPDVHYGPTSPRYG